MIGMENRLYELEEKAEEIGLDAILADFDPNAMAKKDKLTGVIYDAQKQLTRKLDKIFDSLNPGV